LIFAFQQDGYHFEPMGSPAQQAKHRRGLLNDWNFFLSKLNSPEGVRVSCLMLRTAGPPEQQAKDRRGSLNDWNFFLSKLNSPDCVRVSCLM
jgi:hypothetical protein